MKKMRKLIPAISMLLIATIMLSTATFAWFTMNESVEVTGMQIKAKASGSLVISQNPIYEQNLGSDKVELTTTVKNLLPMTHNGTSWMKPTNNKTNNVVTGAAPSGLTEVLSTEISSYIYDETFYIATAGDAISGGSLKINLAALSAPDNNGEAYKAYAAAVYVFEKAEWNTGFNSLTSVPKAIVYVDNAKTESGASTTRNEVTINGVNIPSITGAVDSTSAVGLKVVVRFFVDGDLPALNADGTIKTVNVNHGYTYTQDKAAYSANKAYTVVNATPVDEADIEAGTTDVSTYYTEATVDGKLVYTPATGKAVADVDYFEVTTSTAVADDAIINGTAVPTNWYTYAVYQVPASYTYVRTADAPSLGTSLSITFSTTLSN